MFGAVPLVQKCRYNVGPAHQIGLHSAHSAHSAFHLQCLSHTCTSMHSFAGKSRAEDTNTKRRDCHKAMSRSVGGTRVEFGIPILRCVFVVSSTLVSVQGTSFLCFFRSYRRQ